MNQALPAVSVIGLGNWGLALAQHLAGKGHPVLGWVRDADVRESITSRRRHPRFFPELDIDPGITVTADLRRCASAQIVLYALPSSSLVEIVPQLSPSPDTVVISAVKGLESQSGLTTLQLFMRHFGAGVRTAVISGPSFAVDVIHHRPCGLVAASHDEATARLVAELFSGPALRVYTSTDPIGVEIGGVVKNVIALAAGACDGMELGESARAGLITRGLAEMMRLAEALGGERLTLSGLSGLGDLVMTATSPLSRNRTLGFRLGGGEQLNDIIATLGSVAESAVSAPLVLKLAREQGISMPVTEQVVALLAGDSTPAQLVQNLMQRPLKAE